MKVLKNRRNEFVIETANTSNTATRDSVIEHISSWENEYGRIPLQGIVDLLDDTEYQIFDIAPEQMMTVGEDGSSRLTRGEYTFTAASAAPSPRNNELGVQTVVKVVRL